MSEMGTIELLSKINDCQTKEDLEKLPLYILIEGKKNPQFFKILQDSFIKKKNQIKRAGAWH